MTPSELVDQLKTRIPAILAADLVNNFLHIRSDVATQTLERSAPGKFVETVVQVLQFLDTGQYEKNLKVDEYLKNLESKPTNLPDDLKISVARLARGCYTLRNKRSIAHKGEVDPNIFDLRYLYSASQWILSEMIRHLLSTDISTASRIIEFIQVPVSSIVEDFGDKRLVLKAGTTEEELLTLLFHYFPSPVPVSQIHKDMDRRARSTVSNTITSAYRKRLVEGSKQQGYKLTTLGYQQASEIMKALTEIQS
jgi:hypothetical protein